MLASGLPEHVDDGEVLARFLTSTSQFNSQGVVKHSAFLPSSADHETSVFRHSGEPQTDLWKIGDENVANTRSVYGAGIVKAVEVRAALLDVFADEPPPRHAAIRGWPRSPDDPELQKAQRKERALQVASKAALLRR